MRRRSWIVYGGLLATWILLIVWQAAEHARVEASARAALIDRAKDISNTLGLVMRSQRHFGVINRERLEYALNELVKPGELKSVVLLNATNEIVASAGIPFEPPAGSELLSGHEHWGSNSVTVLNLVDLGTNVTQDVASTNLSIVLPAGETFFPTNRPRNPRFETNAPGMQDRPGMNPTSDGPMQPSGPGEDPGDGSPRRRDWRRNGSGNPDMERDTPPPYRAGMDPMPGGPMRQPGPGEDPGDGSPRRRDWRRNFGTESLFVRPFWMKQVEYESLIKKKGVHSIVLVMSTQGLAPLCSSDLWMRVMIGILGTISVAGWALAWRNVDRTSQLQIRLVRASEQNLHLQEMNLAAAGLAHETRNPLNIIRGLAQLISKEENASRETHSKSRDIIDETDRVTAQLNEFINYSRPRQVRRAPTNIHSVASEVARALSYDVEEKKIRLQILAEPLMIEADEQLLRQALFNLVLNAVQAVEENGEIQVRASKTNNLEAVIEISDNGPGVSPEFQTEIFKPYFTTHQKGTGLGLAVVQQIIMAHGWEIACLANQPGGALFRISHVKVVTH